MCVESVKFGVADCSAASDTNSWQSIRKHPATIFTSPTTDWGVNIVDDVTPIVGKIMGEGEEVPVRKDEYYCVSLEIW